MLRGVVHVVRLRDPNEQREEREPKKAERAVEDGNVRPALEAYPIVRSGVFGQLGARLHLLRGCRLRSRVLLRLGRLNTRVLLRGNLGRATLPALDELLLPLLLRLSVLLAALRVPAPTLARGRRRLRSRVLLRLGVLRTRVLLASLRRGVLLARVLLRVALRLTRVRLRPGVLRAPELLLRLARVGLRLGRLSRLPLLLVWG